MAKSRKYCDCSGQCGQQHGRFHHCEVYEGCALDGGGWATLRPYGSRGIIMCDGCRHAADRYRQDLRKRQMSFGFGASR